MTDSPLPTLEWQLVDPLTDGWALGHKVRGIVRGIVAEVYFDAESNSKIGGWRWFLRRNDTRGAAPSLLAAVAEVEAALGIAEGEHP